MNRIAASSIFSFLVISVSCHTQVEKIVPERNNITLSVYASGKVVSKDQYEVKPNTAGYIREIHVSEGDLVQKGTVLFSLSNETTLLNEEIASLSRSFSERQNNLERLQELEVQIELAKSEMVHDSILVERQIRLRESGIGTDLELEQRLLSYAQRKTAYTGLKLKKETLDRELDHNENTAKKNLEKASALANDLEIKSNIDGKVYSLLKEKGELVNSQNALAIVGNSDEFLLELLVDEYDISQIQPGQEAKISLDSYQDQVFDARITKINPMMDSGNKSFLVEASFVTKPPTLYPNLTLEANIIIEVKENALLIPSSYIFQGNQVISAEGDTLQVTIGIKNYSETEIISGIDGTTELIKP
ncbi:efflux RND transporter periplasmic adaptor subunit [Cyclobacterium jeungdonense]|uniref:Efflux RND transporter periplasmic adaptor subunit n=1 Tax=Cyclobacterium jeungdonense TaxID=708087 RepID=A0ABT8CBW5_9BACT|nr:HlyD family efflux transporter periplasmic adaptor subunit [Cyclobacterium jeungdonense]MDN3689250.1 efflux RND transporter periplasmic adaptor subunit [Cyclobacterium jeungdonense]